MKFLVAVAAARNLKYTHTIISFSIPAPSTTGNRPFIVLVPSPANNTTVNPYSSQIRIPLINLTRPHICSVSSVTQKKYSYIGVIKPKRARERRIIPTIRNGICNSFSSRHAHLTRLNTWRCNRAQKYYVFLFH